MRLERRRARASRSLAASLLVPLLLPLPGLVLPAAAATAPVATAAAATAPAAMTEPAVPMPTATRADRFGVYAWGVDFSAYPVAAPGVADRLNWAAGYVAATGSRTIRVYMGPDDPYRVNPSVDAADERYLERLAASGSAYDTLFADPRFTTYLLTVFTPGDATNWWKGGFKAANAAKEESQIARLGEYLLSEPKYAGKTFILLNWEGDNALGANLAPTAAHYPREPDWRGFTAWVNARAAGVRDARQAAGRSRAHLYSGLEFNLVEAPNGRRCGAGEGAGSDCVVDRVAPYVDVDYYSYSSWQTINVKATRPATSLGTQLATDLRFALKLVKAMRPQVTEANFLVGEFGFARSLYGECTAASWVEEMVRSFDAPGAFGASYAIFWQVLDNRWRSEDGAGAVTACLGADLMLYGLYRGRDLHRTLPGDTLAALLAGKGTSIPNHCPEINSGGVVNPDQAYKTLFYADSRLSIFGRFFAGARRGGDHVWTLQGAATGDHTLTEADVTGGDGWWYDSPAQIDATLPAGLQTDACALVWVDDGQFDSNAQLLTIQAPPPKNGDPDPGPGAPPP